VKLTVLAVGKLRDAWLAEGCAEYEKRVRARLPLEIRELRDSEDPVSKLPSRGRIWALDERGKQLSSEELAKALGDLMRSGEAGLTLVIGGADGLGDEMRKRAHFVWSLSRLTLPHRLVRVVLLEQLYRALSIIRGEPYHRA
jgi:23S rRNA (pseudouridine1915-N3)-methyltransferase